MPQIDIKPELMQDPALLDDREEVNKLCSEQQVIINDLMSQMAILKEQVEYLMNRLYAPKKESAQIDGQLSLFNEFEMEGDPDAPEPVFTDCDDENSDVSDGRKTKKPRKPKTPRAEILASLPVEIVPVTLDEKERVCPNCGQEMTVIGHEVIREELHIEPMQLKRVQYVAEVYACKPCADEGDKDKPVVIKPKAPAPLMKHSLAAPSIVAFVIAAKFDMALTLYRLERAFEQAGAAIPRSTLAKWVIFCTMHYLKPVYDLMVKEFKARNIAHADETPCQVLHEKDKPPQSKSYMWIFLSGDDGGPPIVIYKYDPSRAHTVPEEFLADFNGYLHTDGYDGYNCLEGHVIRCVCFAHVRRKWFEAIPVDRHKTMTRRSNELEERDEEYMASVDMNDDKDALLPAEKGYLFCQVLFQLEKKWKDLAPDERKAKRERYARPVLDKYWQWIDTLSPLNGSKLDKAINYSKENHERLENYLLDGRCSLSNNAAERKAKSYVIGRKNFLFHDTPEGAEASAIAYSMVETAKDNGLDAFKYLNYVFSKMPGILDEPEGIKGLLPWSPQVQEECHAPVGRKDHPRSKGKELPTTE